jgi:hypothetical protein
MPTIFDLFLDEFSTEVGSFIKDEESTRANLIPIDNSGSEEDFERARRELEASLTTFTPRDHENNLEYMKKKLRTRFEKYLNDEITLSEFYSGKEKDYDNITALHSIGVFNLYRHGLTTGMMFFVTKETGASTTNPITGEIIELKVVQVVYIKSVTDNTFTISYTKNGNQAEDFKEKVYYTFYIANLKNLQKEIEEYIAYLTELANKFNRLLEDILNFKYPTEFLGLDISTIPIGTLLKLGSEYKPRTFTDREMLDVIKYFALAIRKIVIAINKLARQQNSKDPIILNSIDALGKLDLFLFVIIRVVDISATINDIVEIAKEVIPKFQILADIIQAWQNPAIMPKLAGIFMQEAQKAVEQGIQDIEKAIVEYLFSLPVPVPTIILDFFLDPKPIPAAGFGELITNIRSYTDPFKSWVDSTKTQSDDTLKAIADYKLKEAEPLPLTTSSVPPSSSTKPAKDL